MTPRQLFADGGTYYVLERDKNPRSSHRHVKIAVVYRLYLDAKFDAPVLIFASTVSRHTEHSALRKIQIRKAVRTNCRVFCNYFNYISLLKKIQEKNGQFFLLFFRLP